MNTNAPATPTNNLTRLRHSLATRNEKNKAAIADLRPLVINSTNAPDKRTTESYIGLITSLLVHEEIDRVSSMIIAMIDKERPIPYMRRSLTRIALTLPTRTDTDRAIHQQVTDFIFGILNDLEARA